MALKWAKKKKFQLIIEMASFGLNKGFFLQKSHEKVRNSNGSAVLLIAK